MFILDFFLGGLMDQLIDWIYSQLVGFFGNFFSHIPFLHIPQCPGTLSYNITLLPFESLHGQTAVLSMITYTYKLLKK